MFSFRKEPQKPKPYSKLGFSIYSTEHGPIEEVVDLPIKRCICRTGKIPQYLVGYDQAQFAQSEIKAAGFAKGRVVDELSSKSTITPEDFERAKQIAVAELSSAMPFQNARKLAEIVAHDTIGYGPIGILMEDKVNIEEIEINSPTSAISIYHSKYGRCVTNLQFCGETEFRSAINRLIYDCDAEINESTPVIDVQVADARIHAQLRPYAVNGACATIRMGGRKESNIVRLLQTSTINYDSAAYLWIAIESGASILISGAPASGKTTLLSSLIALAPAHSRVITIEEDVNELKFYPNVQSVVALNGFRHGKGVDVRSQVINSLRMRPDLLVVGELRGEETRELFTGANFGVPFLATIHSSEAGISVIKRLMVNPMSVQQESLSSLDISVQMTHNGFGSRLVTGITEYKWLSRAEILGGGIKIGEDMLSTNEVALNAAVDQKALSESKIIEVYSKKKSVSKSQALKELRKRADFLKKLSGGTTATIELVEYIHQYGLQK